MNKSASCNHCNTCLRKFDSFVELPILENVRHADCVVLVMQRPSRYIFRNGKVFSYQSPWMKDPARMSDMELKDELEKANEEYRSCIWRMNAVDSQQEPYRSIREKVFAIRREMVNRWYTKTKPGLN